MNNIRFIRKAVLKALLIPLSLSVVCSCSSLHSKKTNVVYECDLTREDSLVGYGVTFHLGKHPRAYITTYNRFTGDMNKSLATCHYSYDSDNRKWLVCLAHKDVEISKGLFDSYSADVTKEYVILQPDEGKAYRADGYNGASWCSAKRELDLGITNDENLCEIAVDHHCLKKTQ